MAPVGQTAFIKQEALEKAREIKVKADEEFAIEKVRSKRRPLSALGVPSLEAWKRSAAARAERTRLRAS